MMVSIMDQDLDPVEDDHYGPVESQVPPYGVDEKEWYVMKGIKPPKQGGDVSATLPKWERSQRWG
jgi:hypothetical protein